MHSVICLLVLAAILMAAYGGVNNCDKNDFKYEYTSCDSDGDRWRVAVPKSDECGNVPPPPPIRGKKCNFTCDTGHYLDISDQECKLCPNGTFSLGGGVRFDDWQTMPPSFYVKVEKFPFDKVFNVHSQEGPEEVNCTGGWVAAGKYLLAKYGDCPITLTYEVDSVRDGSVTFIYENSDENLLLSFEVENQRCEVKKGRKDGDSYKPLRQTEEGEFKKVSVTLPPGQNRLVWTVMSMSLTGIVDDKKGLKKFAKIKMIEVKGVAFTSECTVCRAGTFSGEGESLCQVCSQNTFSKRGSSKCIPCESDEEYSEPGSQTCLKRPLCTENDYLEIITPCNSDGQTKVTYKWNDQTVCNPSLPESTRLPPDGPLHECPPCNPGMQLINGTCSFCPPGEFSSGKKGAECKGCPSSTAPNTGVFIYFWNNLNLSHVNLSTQCLSSSGISSDCKNRDGWVPNKDHIRTTFGNNPSAFLLLNLKIGGFKTSSKRVSVMNNNNNNGDYMFDGEDDEDGEPSKTNYGANSNTIPLSFIIFEFELSCIDNCTLFFIRKTGRGPLTVIETWSGPTQRTKFSVPITSPQPVMFSWTFQQKLFDMAAFPLSSRASPSMSLMKQLVSNMLPENRGVAKIYSLNVTNTIDGGASDCDLCPQGATRDGCVPCPQGHYVDPETKSCIMCPGNTMVSGEYAWGVKSCLTCGESLFHHNHDICITNCTFHSTLTNQTYDFKSLASPRTVEGPRLFTTSGYRYFNIFNISLCSDHRKDSHYPLASCISNFSSHDTKEDQNDEIENLGFEVPVCRSTALPSDKGPSMLTNPISFGDRLKAITDNPNQNIIKLVKDAELFQQSKNASDVYYIYESDVPTRACRSGRLSIIILRCNPDPSAKDDLRLPAKCPDGTCDGCNLVFLWKSHAACPICRPEDYVEFSAECINGSQNVIQKTSRPCYSLTGDQKVKIVSCRNLFFLNPNAPLWVKIVAVLVTVLIIVGFLSIFIVIYCWNKNRKLEYKYMKLIESSTHTKDGMELPGVDSCGIDEGDEEEQFDAVEFKSSSKKNNFFSKLAGQAGSRKGPGFFEKVDKAEKMSLT